MWINTCKSININKVIYEYKNIKYMNIKYKYIEKDSIDILYIIKLFL